MTTARQYATGFAVAAVTATFALSAAPTVAAAHPPARSPGGWAKVPVAARGPIQAVLAKAAVPSRPEVKQAAVLTGSDAANGEALGYSIAISGNTIAVGAPFHAIGTNYFEGAVYVFTKPVSGWKNASKPATLTVAGQTDQGVGRSVAIDGDTIVTGIPGGDGEGGYGGVYVFTKPASGWATTGKPKAFLSLDVPGEEHSDALGISVAISANTVVAGASYWTKNVEPPPTASNTGEVAVFTKPASGWKDETEDATLQPSDPIDQGYFGNAVATDGSTIVVGTVDSDSAYVYVEPKTGWVSSYDHPLLQTAEFTDASSSRYGDSVAVQGSTVVVGAPNSAAAYVYNEPAGGWANTSTPSDTLSSTEYAINKTSTGDIGDSVAISGRRIAVGGENAFGTNVKKLSGGTVSVFTEPAAGWKGAQYQSETLVAGVPTEMLGAAVAIDGSTVVGGSPYYSTSTASDGGAAYVYPLGATTPKPVLSRVTESPKTWKLGSKVPSLNPTKKPSGGTRYSFDLNEKATVSLTFSLLKGKKTVRKGTVTEHAGKGSNHLYFDGLITKKSRLAPGKYDVAFVASNGAGHSAAKTLKFTLK